jgi:hypothetical protein
LISATSTPSRLVSACAKLHEMLNWEMREGHLGPSGGVLALTVSGRLRISHPIFEVCLAVRLDRKAALELFSIQTDGEVPTHVFADEMDTAEQGLSAVGRVARRNVDAIGCKQLPARFGQDLLQSRLGVVA